MLDNLKIGIGVIFINRFDDCLEVSNLILKGGYAEQGIIINEKE